MANSEPDSERDYVLGTHDDEVTRLGVQHEVWRTRVLAAWERAGICAGHTVIDVGSGPGYATLDLADIVGGDGSVIAIDRSRRFLDVLEARVASQGLRNVVVREQDLDDAQFDPDSADAAWCRWVLAFVMHPRDLLERVTRAIRPGGVFVSHEYFDYASWRAMPRSPLFEHFARLIIANWRNSGGEPDIGLQVPGWLEEMGFRIESTRPIVDVITPDDPRWQWPASFMEVGLQRLADLGVVDKEEGARIREALRALVESKTARMVTPGVLEVIARKK